MQERPDPQAILQALEWPSAVVSAPVSGGTDTLIWRIEKAGKNYALRVYQPGQHETCRREEIVMATARAAGLPVPEVQAVGSWQDYPVLLLSWLPGRTLAEELQMHQGDAYHLGLLAGCMQAKLHKLAAPTLLSQQPYAWINWSGPIDSTLEARLQACSRQNHTLLHLDYHPFNLLTDGTHITGIIDWRNAQAGDPRADFARTAAMFLIEGSRLQPSQASLRAFIRGWRAGYTQEHGRPEELSLFYAWAGEVMERDLASKRSPEELARIHNWTQKWKRRANLF
ncbi:aminoglycoside phosphotransferase family protein [Ktedonosporobacter rubrisoli]|uniref:Aminoglycoside phosphotransferase family protein n=1 Tax=Ktedonosporobacter rubrisoli TaxID=2509675 RepID=A0A4P6K0Q7_KTERU|nr:aminoglycoside phosphotransferase family protein [Ktedonosporobacter rubrisoli]QBD81555.1 aminoglycoside phosphotransferase family protein [Ktedonosporobacter rubrisoli]